MTTWMFVSYLGFKGSIKSNNPDTKVINTQSQCSDSPVRLCTSPQRKKLFWNQPLDFTAMVTLWLYLEIHKCPVSLFGRLTVSHTALTHSCVCERKPLSVCEKHCQTKGSQSVHHKQWNVTFWPQINSKTCFHQVWMSSELFLDINKKVKVHLWASQRKYIPLFENN